MKTSNKQLDCIEIAILRIIASVSKFMLSVDDLVNLVNSNHAKVRRAIDKLIKLEYVRILKERNPRILQAIVETPKVSTLLKASVHFSDGNNNFFSKLNFTNTQKYRNLLHRYSMRHKHTMPDEVKNDIKSEILSLAPDQIGSRLDLIANQWCDIPDNFCIEDPVFINGSRDINGKAPIIVQRISEEQFNDICAKASEKLNSIELERHLPKILELLKSYKNMYKKVVGLGDRSKMYQISCKVLETTPEDLILHLIKMIDSVKEAKHKKTFRAKTRLEQMDPSTKAIYEIAVSSGNREWVEELLWSGTTHLQEIKKTRERLRQEMIYRDPSVEEYVEFERL